MDYFVTRHDDLTYISDFRVLMAGDAISEHNLIGLCSNNASDHNLLMCRVEINALDECLNMIEEHTALEHNDQRADTTPP